MAVKNETYNHPDLYDTEPGSLSEGEISGALLGSAFLIFLVLPVTTSYVLVYCKRLHAAWKSRSRRAGRAQTYPASDDGSLEDALARGELGCSEDDATEMTTAAEEPLPEAELTRSEPPPSYASILAEDISTSSGDSVPVDLSPPAYTHALGMEKV